MQSSHSPAIPEAVDSDRLPAATSRRHLLGNLVTFGTGRAGTFPGILVALTSRPAKRIRVENQYDKSINMTNEK